jgi:hypothetical protein
MKQQRNRGLGSLALTALRVFALVSLVRKLGPRRIGRVAALATEAYVANAGRKRRRKA